MKKLDSVYSNPLIDTYSASWPTHTIEFLVFKIKRLDEILCLFLEFTDLGCQMFRTQPGFVRVQPLMILPQPLFCLTQPFSVSFYPPAALLVTQVESSRMIEVRFN